MEQLDIEDHTPVREVSRPDIDKLKVLLLKGFMESRYVALMEKSMPQTVKVDDMDLPMYKAL
ncbi:hypothetical protein DFS34DRAFT_696633 [Phlyctochytrium arcticum]|nr:hypothetical protein DFS34DRAFT_696633 [Phlyctochytrium arcticum]